MNPWPLQYWCSALPTELTRSYFHHCSSSVFIHSSNIWLSYIHSPLLLYSPLHWFIWNQQNDHLSVGLFTSLFAVQTYDFHIFTVLYSPLHRFIWNQQNDQLSVGSLAQLVEHWTGVTEVMGSNPVQAWIFFRSYFRYCSSSVHYCEDCFHINIFICSSNIQCMTFIYSQSFKKKTTTAIKKSYMEIHQVIKIILREICSKSFKDSRLH